MRQEQGETREVMPFPQAAGYINPESEGFKKFTVVNADFVEVPGCSKVEVVKLGIHTIPPFEMHDVPRDATHSRFDTIKVYNYQLIDKDGIPALLRGLNSNDGKWQVGATVYIKGDFKKTEKAA